jgi:nucleotide-binding universal stress UspA family protein
MSIPTFKTILYATDLGKKMRPAFRHAISIAQQYDAKIIMLHVAEPLGATGQAVLGLYAPERVEDFENKELRDILDQMEVRLEQFSADELGDKADLVSSVIAVTGSPAEEINKIADAREVDLIVMGSHTIDSFGSSLLGSTARKLIHISHRPVLVVPVKK